MAYYIEVFVNKIDNRNKRINEHKYEYEWMKVRPRKGQPYEFSSIDMADLNIRMWTNDYTDKYRIVDEEDMIVKIYK